MNEELRAALLAQAEARAAWNALADDATEEDRNSARAALEAADQAVTERLQAGATAPAELRDRISLGRYLAAIAAESVADGVEAELRQELNLADNAIPLEALLPTPEERADAVSPQDEKGAALAFGTVNTTTGPMLTRVFTATDTAFLGISMPAVPPGERVYPVMTDGTDAAMVARGSAAPDATAAKFTVVNATPHRLSGRYVFDLEGVAELGGLLESTLRADLRTVMGYQLDRQVLLGDGTGANVSGLIKLLELLPPPGLSVDANEVSAALTWANGRQIATDGLDGKLARTESDLRILIGGTTYTQARALYRNANAGDSSDLIAALTALGVTIRRSFQIAAPAVATIKGGNAASKKKVQSALVNFEPAAAVAPVWQGITMIRDPYTEAAKAQIVLTAHMLFDFILRRQDGWKRYAIRTEA